MHLADLKQSVCSIIDRHRDRIIDLGEAIWANPEPGFQEFATARLVQATFDDLGMSHRDGLAVTGVRADLDGGFPGPTMALLGEMDSVILPDHPAADPRTGAVHACGHHAQVAGLLGAAMGLQQSGVMQHLAGRIVLMAVPAEECIQLELRQEWIRQGKIGLLGGKQELIRLGHFQDVDLALMIHTAAGRTAHTRVSMNGFSAQSIRFSGRAAHAGANPQGAVNALNAASLALQAIHAQRETFADDEHVRVHPVITRGGDAVSIVPDDVRIESMVRAATPKAITETTAKLRRCCHAAAMAMGADVSINAMPGYLPLVDCAALAAIFEANVRDFVESVESFGHMASSTDMGDITQIMPASHPGIGGAEGAPHSTAFRIVDPELAYVVPAKVLAMCAIDCLAHQAATARRILVDYPPALARIAYADCLRQQVVDEAFRYMPRLDRNPVPS